jgi:hypothetical protein
MAECQPRKTCGSTLLIRYSGAGMRSREEVAKIRAEIERLEAARAESNDGGIRKSIDAWIEEQKKKLIPEDKPE